MKKYFLFGLLFYGPLCILAQDRSQSLETRIQRVLVFINGAQIERSGQISLPGGHSEVVFRGLSSEIEEQSIQVRGIGDFTILSVNQQADFMQEQQLSDALNKIKNQISDRRDAREIQENIISILKKEEEMLASNQSVGNGGAGLDLNRLKQALDFQKARLTENKIKQLTTQKEIVKLNVELGKLENQLKSEAGRPGNKTSNIVVKIAARAATRGNFNLSYVVKNAGWYPAYDIRVTDVNKPVNLVYKANVSQQSGEDWRNVKLILSSGNPSVGGSKPSLRPYQIGYNIIPFPAISNVNQVKGKIADSSTDAPLPGVSIRVKGTSIGATSDAEGNYSIQVPSSGSILEFFTVGYERAERTVSSGELNLRMNPDSRKLEEVVLAGVSTDQALQGRLPGIQIRGKSSLSRSSIPLEVSVQENQTTFQFEVAQPYSIPSDGKLLTVEIGQHDLQADYRYSAVPKLSEEAFLTASVTRITELNLLSGEANIFFDGAYLGKTLLNAEVTTDTLSVSLGSDKNIIVKRVQQKDQADRSMIGTHVKVTKAYNFEIFNRRSEPVNLSLEDQVPISNTSEVSVDKQEVSGALLDDSTGLLKWNLQLQPQEKRLIKLKYQVKYPKWRPVRLD